MQHYKPGAPNGHLLTIIKTCLRRRLIKREHLDPATPEVLLESQTRPIQNVFRFRSWLMVVWVAFSALSSQWAWPAYHLQTKAQRDQLSRQRSPSQRMEHLSEAGARLLQPREDRSPRSSETHVCVYSGVDSSSGWGGIGQTWGVANGRRRHGCVCVCVWGNTEDRSGDIHGENEGQDTKFSTNSKETDRRRVLGARVPQTCTAPAWKGSPREGETDAVETGGPQS